MNPVRLMPLVATVTTVASTGPADEFGDPTKLTSERSFRAWLEQVQRSEDTAGTDQQAEGWRLYLEPAAAGAVKGSDRVTVDGVTYELDGPPWSAVNPRTGQTSHVEATMKRVV